MTPTPERTPERTPENHKHMSSTYLSSEHYRQMLVRDGERRFQEWHGKFLAYQQKFLAAMQQIKAGVKQ